jgi:NADPH:quinone reductase-like Zn-dependent oxidoreductase
MFIGKIVAFGNSVKQVQIGQLVFAFHHHEESFNIPFNQVKLVPEGISPEDAVFLPNVETAINFVHDGRPMLGEKVNNIKYS